MNLIGLTQRESKLIKIQIHVPNTNRKQTKKLTPFTLTFSSEERNKNILHVKIKN